MVGDEIVVSFESSKLFVVDKSLLIDGSSENISLLVVLTSFKTRFSPSISVWVILENELFVSFSFGGRDVDIAESDIF